MPENKRNVILTGMPRSGTTLLTAMFDSAPDSVALNEPKWQYDWAQEQRATCPPEDFARWLVGDFVMTRQKLLKSTPLPERRGKDGAAVTDYYRTNPQTGALEDAFSTVPFVRSGLTPEFRLAIKHNGLYLGAFQQIIETGFFEIYVIVRHPVNVIASWNRAPIPLAQGKIPGAALYWDEMRTLTHSSATVLEKQVGMYDLLARRIDRFRGQVHLIFYEELVRNPQNFCAASSIPYESIRHLISDRKPEISDEEREKLTSALKRHGQYYTRLYPNV